MITLAVVALVDIVVVGWKVFFSQVLGRAMEAGDV